MSHRMLYLYIWMSHIGNILLTGLICFFVYVIAFSFIWNPMHHYCISSVRLMGTTHKRIA